MQLDYIKLVVSLVLRAASSCPRLLCTWVVFYTVTVLNSTGAHVHPEVFVYVCVCMFV